VVRNCENAKEPVRNTGPARAPQPGGQSCPWRHRQALEQFLGSAHGLSASTNTRLTKDCLDEAAEFNVRSLAETDYVYVWVDGIHLKVRLEQDKVCLLVMIGVRGRWDQGAVRPRGRAPRVDRVLAGPTPLV